MNQWLNPTQSRRAIAALISSVAACVALASCAKREEAVQYGAVRGPKLVLTGATVAPTVAVGQTADFRLSVANTGPRDASRVRIVDTVGKQSRLLSITCTASGGGSCPSELGPEMLVDALPRGGVLNFSVSARLIDRGTGTVINSMTASTADATDPNQRGLADSNESTVTNDVMVR